MGTHALRHASQGNPRRFRSRCARHHRHGRLHGSLQPERQPSGPHLRDAGHQNVQHLQHWGIHMHHCVLPRHRPVRRKLVPGDQQRLHRNLRRRYLLHRHRYTKTSDTAIAVENGDTYNCNTTDATTGTCTEFTSLINGTAEVTDSSEPGQLTLTLYTPFLFGLSLPTTGSYWICKLGPVVNGKYAYAIVSDSDGVSLYVLARNVESFYSTYYDEVYDYINSDLSWMVGGPTGTLEPIDNTFGTCPGDGDDSFY